MTGIAMYLFGDHQPDIASLIRDRGFQDLVRELFRAEAVTVPSDPPLCFKAAMRLGLLTISGQSYRAGPRLAAVPTAAERALCELLRPTLAHYVEIAEDTASELRTIYEQIEVSEHFSWPQVSHSMVAGMFLDLAMGLEILRSGRVPHRPVGDTIVWAFESVSAENAYGVQWTPASEGRTSFAQLWHRRSRRASHQLSPVLVERLLQVAYGEKVDRNSKELLCLRHLKLVRTIDSTLRLQVPFFGVSDTERLLVPLTRGAGRLVEDSIFPALDCLSCHPWWREKAKAESYRHAAVRLVLEYGADCIIGSKVLSPFPEPQNLPLEWGRWLWKESDGSAATLMPTVAMGQQVQAIV